MDGMKIGIIGAGDVAKTLAVGLSKNHEVKISSRNPDKNKEFMNLYPKVEVATFNEVSIYGELIINALPGNVSLNVLETIKPNLENKVMIDLANPLDFSKDSFELFVANNDSLGEQIQRLLPNTYVVKALNTVTAKLMVNPSSIKNPHDIFICGNHEDAKKTVRKILEDDFGWETIHDLGDIQGSRAMEQLMHIWLKLWGNIGHTMFNFHIEVK
jgi:8-hydroxy-5-deazaflavin:NADPH oxidoreductase